MLLLLVFLLGIANFAMHKAVIESRHSLLAQMPRVLSALGGRFSLLVEFVLLLGAMLMVANGSQGWALFYGLYTGVNAVSSWLLLSGRI